MSHVLLLLLATTRSHESWELCPSSVPVLSWKRAEPAVAWGS